MKTYDVIFSDGASEDLDAILDYISRHDPHRAIGFVREMRQRAIDFLSITPMAGSPIGRFRYFVIRRYIVVYDVMETTDSVVITFVTEGHRDWRRMVEDIS